MKCIFGCRNAVAIYILPKGCACFPDRIVHALCAQHEHKCTPLGRMILVKRFWGETMQAVVERKPEAAE